MKSDRRPYVLISALVVGMLVPFISRPLHIDDPFWLWTAKQITLDPLNFYGYKANWFGTLEWMHQITKTPPLFSYWLALGGTFFGWGEKMLHILMIPISMIFALGMYSLARRVAPRPLFATILAVLSPVFILSGISLMCDSLMATFWIWSMVFWIEGLSQNRNLPLIGSSFLCGLSCLTKYNGVTLIPILILYTILRNPKMVYKVLYLTIPIGMVLIYRSWTKALYGNDVVLQTLNFSLSMGGFSPGELWEKTQVGLMFLGGVFAPLFLFIGFLWKRRALVFWSVFLLASFFFYLSDPSSLGIQKAVWITAGGHFLVLSVLDICKRRDAFSWALFSWVFGMFIFAAYLNWSVTGRAFILLVPAVGILVTRRMEDVGLSMTFQMKSKMGLSLFASLVVGMFLAHADTSQAQSIKKAVDFVFRKVPENQNTIWFQGHWGFQYYMEQKGAQALDFSSSTPQKGDILIVPVNNSNLRQPVGVELFGTLDGPVNSRITLMNLFGRAGYYSSVWGPLPFRFFYNPLETVLFFKITEPDLFLQKP